ncbi:MAG: Rieske 2Fe-2S domain-containing protein [Actinomycetota bacterium]
MARGLDHRHGCPHLGWDLAEALVVEDELVRPGHGWPFDCAGRAQKRARGPGSDGPHRQRR